MQSYTVNCCTYLWSVSIKSVKTTTFFHLNLKYQDIIIITSDEYSAVLIHVSHTGSYDKNMILHQQI